MDFPKYFPQIYFQLYQVIECVSPFSNLDRMLELSWWTGEAEASFPASWGGTEKLALIHLPPPSPMVSNLEQRLSTLTLDTSMSSKQKQRPARDIEMLGCLGLT